MQRLSVPDAGWLLMEGRERPMHVGGLQLFRLPDDASPTFLRDLVAGLLADGAVRAPFSHRLARPYGRGGIYQWVEDEVDLEYHVRHLALPEPGRIRELLALVSQLHSTLLDRHRPLWETYLIEGIEDRRFALYSKIHHSMLDGVAAMKQLVRSFSSDPDARDLPPPWAPRDGRGGERSEGDGALARASALVQATTAGLRSLGRVTRVVGEQVIRSQFEAAEVVPFQAPPSMLNVGLTSARRFVAQSYELERVREVGRALDATVNDVVLAVCSGALRRYLQAHDALPARPLLAMVPVSFRQSAGGGDVGNAITLVPANLATHLEDPGERLGLIRASMDAVKARLGGLSPTALVQYGIAMTAPLIAGQLTGLSGRMRPSFNLVVSNVPGPDEPLFWNGARMEGLYPLSLLTDGYALNITLLSYAGSLDVGITADRRALPSVQRIIDHLEESLVELELTAGT